MLVGNTLENLDKVSVFNQKVHYAEDEKLE